MPAAPTIGGDRRRPVGHRDLDPTHRHRGPAAHGLRDHALHRDGAPGLADLPRHGHLAGRHRPDQRLHLHVQGRRHQHPRPRRVLELVGRGGPAGPPSAPTIGTATAGNASATVRWTAPANDGGHPITGYVVTPILGSVSMPATTFNSTATTQIVTGLINGAPYRFTVAAINVAGTGPQSAQSNVVNPQAPTRPGAPTIGTATAGNAKATVTWTAPESDGGSPITGYVVTPLAMGDPRPAQTFESTDTTQVITGLSNGIEHTFVVQAINAIGTGDPSAESNPVTPASSATLTGIVRGPGNQPVKGVVVQVPHPAATTDQSGACSIPDLPLGSYTVGAEASAGPR
ncbi:MAG: fibronectin type III domain-containing protein [Acidimicrobiales bacterium]